VNQSSTWLCCCKGWIALPSCRPYRFVNGQALCRETSGSGHCILCRTHCLDRGAIGLRSQSFLHSTILMREYIPPPNPIRAPRTTNSGNVPIVLSSHMPPTGGKAKMPQTEVILETQDIASANLDASLSFTPSSNEPRRSKFTSVHLHPLVLGIVRRKPWRPNFFQGATQGPLAHAEIPR